jgi:hypothetical protein
MKRLFCAFAFLSFVTCSLALAQESASLKAPDIAKAGETVDLDITLDRAPNFNGSFVSFLVTGPENFSYYCPCELKRGERTCHYPFRVPMAAPAGTYYVSSLKYSNGVNVIDLSFEKLPFQVIATPGLVFPTSASVSVNPSQIQLLRREISRLQTDMQTLKGDVAELQEKSPGGEDGTLIHQLQAEIGSVRETQGKFQSLDNPEIDKRAAEVFFDDLVACYQQVIAAFPASKTKAQLKAPLIRVAWPPRSPAKVTYTLAAQAAFWAIEQNELAYMLVADTESLTFDLEVSSAPEGATVSYHRRGDPYQYSPKPTESVVKALPFAIWLVRCQKDGYIDKEVEHDPFREHDHHVVVELTKK